MTTPGDAAFRRLELTVRRRIASALAGDHAGLALGTGTDPEELVAYQPGHDVRRIDWNATARANGEPQVWLTRAEHALETWVLLDESPSMAFGSGALEKRDVAAWVTAAFGMLTQGSGDRIGIGVLSADGTRWYPPRSGRVAARHVSKQPAPRRDGMAPTTLADALMRLGAQAPKPGLRVVVTDLLDPDGASERPFDWEAPLKGLAARHDVIVVEIIDPRELEIPDVGVVVFTDPESGAQIEVGTSDPAFRALYAATAAGHRESTVAAVRGAGGSHLVLRTDDDLARSIVRFVHRRRREPARTPGRTR